MPSIFMSYRRRGEGAGYAHRLADRINEHFGEEQLFKDIEDIDAGIDFVEEIIRTVSSSQALIAVVGPTWLTATDAEGQRRLEDPKDFLRLEIRTAIKQGIRVIPVLVGGATMPSPEDLPVDLKELSRRNAVELSDTRWNYDVEQLLAALERMGLEPLHGRKKEKRSWKKPVIIAGVSLAVVAAAAASIVVIPRLISSGGDGSPRISEFSAVPDSIAAGESSLLRWVTANADSVILNGEPVEASGSRRVNPSTRTTYRLAAAAADKEPARQEVTIRVAAPVVVGSADLTIPRFALDPGTPTQGRPVTVYVAVQNAGDRSAEGFGVEWWAGENFPGPACTWQVDGLGPQGSRPLTCEYAGYESWYGSLVTKVVVDPQNRVAESDESNTRGLTIEVRRADSQPTPPPTTPAITFARLPDGTVVNADRFLKGNEFTDQGIRGIRGAPEGSYCSDATKAAIKTRSPSGTTPGNFLTTASKGDLNRCNTIPLEIRFTSPVRMVGLAFFGAATAYTIKAYDSAGNLLRTAERSPQSVGQVEKIGVSVSSASISRVTFGRQAALTAVTEIWFER
jgi:CARDB/TIR domain